MASAAEVVVVPHPHPGHIFPAIELCNQLAARNYKVTVFLPSTSSSAALHPLITVVQFSLPHPTQFPPHLLDDILPPLLARRFHSSEPTTHLPICAVVDDMISWLIDTFAQIRIPAASFFTSSAISAAIQVAASRISPEELIASGRSVIVPGLPDGFAIGPSDLDHRGPPRGPFGPGRRGDHGPRKRGVAAATGAAALLFNTCDDLERPFLDYVAKEAGKPVWGVGPLLPASFWSTATGSPSRDEEVRGKHESSVSEEEVMAWLDAQPRGSVIYVAFGTLVRPSDQELEELAAGLKESNQRFIWVIQNGATGHDPDGRPFGRGGGEGGGSFAEDMARRAGGRGLTIEGWAPQLAILRHRATGGYVCHCGWNSTTEALACGVPVLTWPVRGDQMHNARLLTDRLGVGLPIRSGGTAVTRGDVVRGIEKLMGDEEMRKRVAGVRAVLAAGFPTSSAASLDTFLDLVKAEGQWS